MDRPEHTGTWPWGNVGGADIPIDWHADGRHYERWRDEQLRACDEDYRAWRAERFSADFDDWRRTREGRQQASRVRSPGTSVEEDTERFFERS